MLIILLLFPISGFVSDIRVCHTLFYSATFWFYNICQHLQEARLICKKTLKHGFCFVLMQDTSSDCMQRYTEKAVCI